MTIPRERQRTSSPVPPASALHEHGWLTESAHRTSVGVVLYVRCAGCGIRRVDVRDDEASPPVPLTVPVGYARAPSSP